MIQQPSSQGFFKILPMKYSPEEPLQVTIAQSFQGKEANCT